jgi:RNA polymerase sigma factor (sigma-70 family)
MPLEVSAMPASDATLVRGVLSGDRNAFAELYDRWAGLIRAMCFDAIRDLDAAEDLAQEVFLRALRKLGSLRDPARFVSWLMGIARHVCREWRRGQLQNRRRLTSLTDDLPFVAEDSPSDDRSALLREALAALPERERLSLQAFYLRGLDAEQARTALGLSQPTFYRVLASARQRLRQTLSRQEVLS